MCRLRIPTGLLTTIRNSSVACRYKFGTTCMLYIDSFYFLFHREIQRNCFSDTVSAPLASRWFVMLSASRTSEALTVQ